MRGREREIHTREIPVDIREVIVHIDDVLWLVKAGVREEYLEKQGEREKVVLGVYCFVVYIFTLHRVY